MSGTYESPSARDNAAMTGPPHPPCESAEIGALNRPLASPMLIPTHLSRLPIPVTG